MLSPQALIRGLVQRALPSFNPDSSNSDVALRQLSYGEVATQPLVRKSHNLSDEGSYFVTNNSQTGITPTFGTSLVATSPFIVIQNQGTQRAYLDFVSLTGIVAGACTTTLGYTAISVVVDSILRYTSGGTALPAAFSPNMALPNTVGVNVWCGAIVATAASTAARTVTGIRNIRAAVSATVINMVGDVNMLNFGGVEGGLIASTTTVNPIMSSNPLPPVILGPGNSALIYIWYPVMAAPSAATYAPEIGFWVR